MGRDWGREGFALPLMLAVLAVVSMLVAASFLSGRLESQSGRNALQTAHAFETAELGLSEILGWWDPGQFNRLPIGNALVLPTRTLGKRGYTGGLIRLSAVLFEVRSDAWYQGSGNLPTARRSLRSLVRLNREKPGVSAALTIIDSIGWDGASLVSGHDSIPPGWEIGCTPDSSVAGLMAPPAAQLSLGSCPACFRGAPAVGSDTALTMGHLAGFGSAGYGGLAARANLRPVGRLGPIGPAVAGSPPTCVVSDSLNWGEPLRVGPWAPCASYFPVIHVAGNLKLTGGRGQGILLVDGDLDLGGGFEFTGLVLVLGTVRNDPGGGSIVGALLARRLELGTFLSPSTITIQYSACVLPTSMIGTSLAIPLPFRSWAQRF